MRTPIPGAAQRGSSRLSTLDSQLSTDARSSILQLAAILALALYLLNLGYGFENSFQPLGKFQFISRTLGGPDAHTTAR